MKRKPTIRQVDPTGLNGLRRYVIGLLRKQYLILAQSIRKLFIEDNVLGNIESLVIGNIYFGYTSNVGTWSYESNPNKVKRFREYLREKLGSTLSGDALIQSFIDKAYSRGIDRSFRDIRKRNSSVITGRRDSDSRSSISKIFRSSRIETSTSSRTETDNFVRIRMSSKPTVEKVKLLASRTFSELEGINQRMAANMSRALAEGLAYGRSVKKITQQIVAETGIAFSRATTIVKTEIMRAHAEGQLDTLSALGEEAIGVAVEFQTVDDDKVCPKCQSLNGKTFGIDEARGLIPVHPNCRCAFIPLKVASPTGTRKRI